MVSLCAYMDDSKGEGADAYLTLAGYLAPPATWDAFPPRWQAALDQADVPYLHIKEFGSPNGVYAKWYADNGEADKIAFFRSLIAVIEESKLSPIGETMRLGDIARFNRDFGLNLDPYSLALYLGLIELSLMYPMAEVEIVLDRIPDAHSKIALARQYIRSDQYYKSAGKIIDRWKIAPLDKKLSFRNVLPLQAADFLAWEARKSATRRDEWFVTEKPRLRPEEWLGSLLFWEVRKMGSIVFPRDMNERRSFIELKKNLPIEGQVWDYQALCGVHKARGGHWGLAAGARGGAVRAGFPRKRDRRGGVAGSDGR